MEGRPNINTDGYVWVKERCQERIQELHETLETPGMDMERTSLIRGQLQEVRRILTDAKRAAGVVND